MKSRKILLSFGVLPFVTGFHPIISLNKKRQQAPFSKASSIQRHSFIPSSTIINNNKYDQTSSRLSVSSTSSIWEGTIGTIRAFSKSSLIASDTTSSVLESMTARAVDTPSVAYFLALMAAGLGIPVSEDALCVFVGAIWNRLNATKRFNTALALYWGVVMSDWLTFLIGRILRKGVFAPLAERLGLMNETSASTLPSAIMDSHKQSKMQRLNDWIRQRGNWCGFLIRFSVGTRGPLMLLTGFSQQVSFANFAAGASAGAIFTLPMQLMTGFLLGRQNPGAVVGIVAGISTFVLTAAAVMAIASTVTFLSTRVSMSLQKRKQLR